MDDTRLPSPATAQVMRGDDVDIAPAVREVVEHYRGTGLAGPQVMALALQHARRGDAQRAGVLAGWARAAVARTKSYPCPIDLHMRARLRELVPARYDDAQLEAWQRAGERLDETELIAIAFDGAPLPNLERSDASCSMM
jgi:hypothetical protein